MALATQKLKLEPDAGLPSQVPPPKPPLEFMEATPAPAPAPTQTKPPAPAPAPAPSGHVPPPTIPSQTPPTSGAPSPAPAPAPAPAPVPAPSGQSPLGPPPTPGTPQLPSPPPAAPITPESFDPTLRTVDESRETVAGQLDRLLSRSNPLLQRAESQALRNANAMGLLNSSMANSAALAAMIDAALPIAQSDAGLYAGVGRDNNALINQAGQQNVNTRNEFLAREQQQRLALEQARTNAELQMVANERMAEIEQRYRTITNVSQNAGAALQEMNARIGAILADPQIPLDAKQQLIDQVARNTENMLRTLGIINGLDFGDLLNFSPTTSPLPPTPAPSPSPSPSPPPGTPPEQPNDYQGAGP